MKHGLIIIAALLSTAPAWGKTNSLGVVLPLIQDLGAADAASRNHAQEQLMRWSRDILPTLEEHADSTDPEVRIRINRIIDHLKWSPSKVPQFVWLFDRESGLRWNASVADWRREATASVDHPGGGKTGNIAANYESVAQSVVPLSTNITAVQIQVSPLREKDEWFRVELREDDKGRPGRYVLTRAWIRVDEDLPTDRISSLPFDVPDVVVVSNKTYWIVYTAVRGPACRAINFSPLTLSQEDSYKPGQCLFLSRNNRQPATASGDLHFSILSDCSSVPLLRRASETEMKVIPDTSKVDAFWLKKDR